MVLKTEKIELDTDNKNKLASAAISVIGRASMSARLQSVLPMAGAMKGKPPNHKPQPLKKRG